MAVRRPRPVKIKGHGHVNVSSLKVTARNLRRAAGIEGPDGTTTGKAAAGDLGKRLFEAGEFVAGIARRNAAEFSETVPGSIRVMGGTSAVYIRAGGPKGPPGYTAETAARHPLFGNRNYWFQGPIHPFLAPAGDEGAEGAAAIVAQVIDDWAEEYGFR